MLIVGSFGVRHLQAFLAFLYLTVAFVTRVDISVAIIAITDVNAPSKLRRDWNEFEKGLVLSSFFIGYIFTQIPGGRFAEQYGAKPLMIFSMFINGVCAFLTIPAVYYTGPLIVSFVRFWLGVAQGVFFPCLNVYLMVWLPPRERPMFYPPAFSGLQVGTLLGMFFAGFISSVFSWPWVFLVSAIISFLWCLLMYVFGASIPEHHPFISVIEKVYIEAKDFSQAYVPTRKQLAKYTPWKEIMRSKPFLATCVAHAGHNWCYSFLLTQLPAYMTNVLGLNVAMNGIVSAMLHAVCGLLILVNAFTTYKLVITGVCSVNFMRKLWTSLDLWGMASSMFLLIILSTRNPVISLPLLCSAIGFTSCSYTGFFSGITDLSPNYSGTLLGISNFVGSISALLSPLSVSLIVTKLDSLRHWNLVFTVNMIILVFSNCIYLIFFIGVEQSWNVPNELKHRKILKVKSMEKNKNEESEHPPQLTAPIYD